PCLPITSHPNPSSPNRPALPAAPTPPAARCLPNSATQFSDLTPAGLGRTPAQGITGASPSHFGVDVATPPEELTKLYDSIFEKFDCDRSGTVDQEEFRSEMKNILLAIADGLGSSPIQMALEDDDKSFLKQAADLEASKFSG
ncbi:hypothetical protein PHJA_001864700, partial [Phtheirospermum japonicum]